MAKIIPVPAFDAVVFGATGDLTRRKLLPALYYRFRDGQMPPESCVIGAARSDLSDEDFRKHAEEAVHQFVPASDRDTNVLARFCSRLGYVRIDAASDDGWDDLRVRLQDSAERVRMFYLATSPDIYGAVCQRLKSHGVVTPLSRVVLEKPIGHDLDSARAINEQVGEVFDKSQIFRIDHYLGKETVQNLMALRFANTIYERLWNTDVIDHVQITVAETVGVEGRGGYYDRSGALRDMVQNHMLQLLCLLAMEQPISLDADAVRNEKLKVLRALRPMEPHEVGAMTVRGQYARGAVDGKPVPGYLADLGDDHSDHGEPSRTETFVALKAYVRTWRWANVPFYLRTGKRLPQKVSEIVLQFRALPFSIYPSDAGDLDANRLVIRLQPQEGMRLEMMTKEPGPGGLHLRPTGLDISFEKTFRTRYPDAYERLLMDTVRGNATLFMRRDEVEAAWSWVQPIVDAWSARADQPRAYAAGSWPDAAIELIARDRRRWYDDPTEMD